MKKSFLFAVIICAALLSGCYVNGDKVPGTSVRGEPDPVYIDNFCGVDLEFGATYVTSNNEWFRNKIYIRQTNQKGADILIMEGNRVAFDSGIGYNANSCINFKGEDGYYHTGCPYDIWLEINAHVEIWVTTWDANNQPVDCPRNGEVFDMDP